MLTCTLQSLINIPGKADATLCASHVFVTLEAIIHYSSVSDGAIPASDQFRGSKADMPGFNRSAQCFEAWYAAHLTKCITHSSRLCYNDIFKVLKFSCSDRDRFQRKNNLITSVVGSLKVCFKYAGFTFTHSSCGGGTFFVAEVPNINSTSHN